MNNHSAKTTANKLHNAEEKLKYLVDLSPNAIFVHRNGIFLYANKTGAELLGINNPDELTGRSALDFVHPDYKQTVIERIKQGSKEKNG